MKSLRVILIPLIMSAITAVSAFGPSQPLALRQTATTLVDPFRLYSTPSPSQDLDDEELPDEIAALLAKGKKLRAKMQDRPATPPVSDEADVEVNEWTDLEKLPEFKTKVPERQVEQPKTDDQQDDNQKKSSPRQVVDYMLDFPDENDLHIPNRIGFTTKRWGDTSQGFVTGNQKLTKKMKRAGKFVPGDCQVAYNLMLESSVFFVETSESYGKGSRGANLSAEDVLSRCISENDDFEAPLLASTFGGFRLLGRGIFSTHLEESCNRMDQPAIELYQSRRCLLGLGKAFLQALEEGMCNNVGVIDFGKRGMRRMANSLDDNGYALTSNQFEFGLTNRKALKSGLLEECKELGVIPLIRNPLDKNDLASGRYTATNPSGGDAGSASGPFKFSLLEKLQPLHTVQETIAERVSNRVKRENRGRSRSESRRFGEQPGDAVNTDISTTHVAINYVVAKGGVPLVDVYNTKSAEVLKGCLGWSLTDEEVDMLDKAAMLCDL